MGRMPPRSLSKKTFTLIFPPPTLQGRSFSEPACALAHKCSLILTTRPLKAAMLKKPRRGPYANQAHLNFTQLLCIPFGLVCKSVRWTTTIRWDRPSPATNSKNPPVTDAHEYQCKVVYMINAFAESLETSNYMERISYRKNNVNPNNPLKTPKNIKNIFHDK